MELAISVVTVSGDHRNLLVHTGADATVAELATVLASRVGTTEDASLYLGSRLLSLHGRLDRLGIPQGAIVRVAVAVGDPDPSPGPLEVAVIGGPGAGPSVPIYPGEQLTAGRAAADALLID